jgi:hypothetical protein
MVAESGSTSRVVCTHGLVRQRAKEHSCFAKSNAALPVLLVEGVYESVPEHAEALLVVILRPAKPTSVSFVCSG